MIAKTYNPKDTIGKKRAILEDNLYVASARPEDLYKDAEWLDAGHVGSKLRREFAIKYLLRCAYRNYIPALQKFVFLYEVGKHRPPNPKKAHCYALRAFREGAKTMDNVALHPLAIDTLRTRFYLYGTPSLGKGLWSSVKVAEAIVQASGAIDYSSIEVEHGLHISEAMLTKCKGFYRQEMEHLLA
ncbi:hypothetical protein N9368_02650 [Alphaproteobacteria bacterium]|nr:hypothetical protein [Alphaproteobacteria bacterium]